MTDTQIIIAMFIGWVCHAFWVRAMAWCREMDRIERESIYDWERNDDEFGW